MALTQAMVQGVLAAAREHLPAALVDVLYDGQTVKDAIRTTVSLEQVAVAGGDASQYEVSVRLLATELRDRPKPHASLVVIVSEDGQDVRTTYTILTVVTDPTGALYRLDLGGALPGVRL